MKVLGIIAEYNPFHNGHLYHLKKSREVTQTDVTVAVMSGNFVQRGEPAIIDKWKRSEMAVRNGVDLVLELPFVYACNNAEIFAKGSVLLLDGLGIIDSICFGSEDGDLESLKYISDYLTEESPKFSDKIKEKIGEGLSYPKARQEALAYFIGENKAKILESPNNILGIEYLKQLKISKSKIRPYTIKRKGASLDEIDVKSKIAGATAIREMVDNDDFECALEYLPKEIRNIIKSAKKEVSNYEMFREMIIYSIISKTKIELSEIYSITEGLENKILESSKKSSSIDELIENIKSKRYTQTRIQRILIHILIGLTNEKMTNILENKQMYGRVLAFNEKGAALLKKIKKEEKAKTPIITNIKKEADMLKSCQQLFDFDMIVSDIYNLAVTNDIYGRSDYRRIPEYV